MTSHSTDILVIGSGAAGLTAALGLAQRHKVTVLAKGPLKSGSTAWAQGGIAAVLDAGDTFEDHIRDTMVAGAGLNRLETVEFVVDRSPAAIASLVELGEPFLPLANLPPTLLVGLGLAGGGEIDGFAANPDRCRRDVECRLG